MHFRNSRKRKDKNLATYVKLINSELIINIRSKCDMLMQKDCIFGRWRREMQDSATNVDVQHRKQTAAGNLYLSVK